MTRVTLKCLAISISLTAINQTWMCFGLYYNLNLPLIGFKLEREGKCPIIFKLCFYMQMFLQAISLLHYP